MEELKPEKLKQKTLELYRDAYRFYKMEKPKDQYIKGALTAYRNILQNMGYKWRELIDMEFVNQEIQGLRTGERTGEMTKEKFKAYVAVQKSGVTNMFSMTKVIEAAELLTDTKLTKEDILIIMRNYGKLEEEYE